MVMTIEELERQGVQVVSPSQRVPAIVEHLGIEHSVRPRVDLDPVLERNFEPDQLPLLALAHPTARRVKVRIWHPGYDYRGFVEGAGYWESSSRLKNHWDLVWRFGHYGIEYERTARTRVPAVPAPIATNHDLEDPTNYVLFEPRWRQHRDRYVDPALLHRLPTGLYEVLAVWDLTLSEAKAIEHNEIDQNKERRVQ